MLFIRVLGVFQFSRHLLFIKIHDTLGMVLKTSSEDWIAGCSGVWNNESRGMNKHDVCLSDAQGTSLGPNTWSLDISALGWALCP